MLKGTGLTLWLVSNCAYIVRLSNCPPHLTQVFHAGGRQWWWGVRWGGGFDTEKMPNRYLQKRERLGPQLPAISAGVALDSCKKPAGREEDRGELAWVRDHTTRGRWTRDSDSQRSWGGEHGGAGVLLGGSSGEGDPSGESSSQLRVPAPFIEFVSTFFTSASLTVYSVLC